MANEMEIKNMLIDDYYYNLDLLKAAMAENAIDTASKIKEKLEIIKLKLQPLELPDFN